MFLSRNNYIVFILLLLVGCSNYDQSTNFENLETINIPFYNNSPTYKIYENFNKNKPSCIIVLPFKKNKEKVEDFQKINLEELLRHTLYAHLSPLQYRDIEISKVDYFININNNLEVLSSNLGCNNFMEGTILKFTETDLKVYSNISAEVHLKLFNKENTFWESKYRIDTHGGNIPLSPIGIAFGLADAARNLESVQYIRVADEIIRGLISTLPDNNNLQYALSIEEEKNIDGLKENLVKTKTLNKGYNDFIIINEKSIDELMELLDSNINNEQKLNIYKKIIEQRPEDIKIQNDYSQFLFDNNKYKIVQNRINDLIKNGTYDKDTYFLKGRVHLLLNELELAEKSFINSTAIDEKDALSLNALGYVYSINNKDFKAEAAYKMAISIEEHNIFSHLNLGILKSNRGEHQEALEYLEKAAILSINQDDYKRFLISISKIEALKIEKIKIASTIANLKKLKSWENY